jgi:hypothetical protein
MQPDAERTAAALTRARRFFYGCDAMANSFNRLYRPALAAAGIVLLSAGPSLAQRAAVPCDAFARNSDGGWRVLSPVMLDLDGRLYSPMVGTLFGAGSMQDGIEMSDVLDQQCGNR